MGFITKDKNGKKLRFNDVVLIEWGFRDFEITTMCFTTPMNMLTTRSRRQTLYSDSEHIIEKIDKKNFNKILKQLNKQTYGVNSVFNRKKSS